ncbi:winged helix-turn-helix domain-containing protein [Streptomyces sp. NRRL S-646]|uniref:winged helix-turn-helix domain-containing protein n=1 Tax=Streptomyces sp. NRRL S-646 TaxID=1463917 RepID=UPI000560C652|nr:winged helix-turn-helix domain-containing protein [Streptomyces sp. NRRL S-646]
MPKVIAECGNLPAAITSFVGRRQETAEIRRLLGMRRLVTLTGMGGVGKTRLALEVAAASREEFADGVWLVDLAPVCEASAVAAAAAGALRVPDLGALPVMDQLTGYLAGRRALLVLDNCEHLVEACAELAGTLLSAAPELRILATSRHTMGVTGEHVFTLAPLAQDDAVELLRDRAVAVWERSHGDEAGHAAIARLCADLDCLPLAIELAASRLRTLTVGQLTDRLENRFALLTGGSRTAPAHQRTLRAMIDWSYELCAPAERLLWNRLTVFAGGFSLEAAEGVCCGEGIAEAEVLDLLDRLVAQSVVLTCKADGQRRYRLLASIREYGRERLADSGEQDELRRRHRDFFLALAHRIDRNWYGPGQVENLARLRVEHPNLLAALDYEGDPRSRLALVAALRWHWCAGGFLSEGRRQFERVLAAAPESGPERARALLVAVWAAQTQGDLATADRWLDEADALGEWLGDPWVRIQASGLRGVSAQNQGRPRDSICRYEEALAAMTALGDECEAASWRLALAFSQAHFGDPRAAQTGAGFTAAARASGDRWGRALVLMALGHDAWARGDREATETLVRSALEGMRGFNDYAMVGRMLELLAWATAAGGAHERAARLLGLADALWHDAGSSICAFGPQMAEWHARCEQAAIAALGEASYRQAFAEGGTHRARAQAVDFALALDTDSGAGPACGRDTAYDTGTEYDAGTDADGERGAERGIGTAGDTGTGAGIDADSDIDVKETAPSAVRRRHAPAAADTGPASPDEGPRVCDVLLVEGDPTVRESARRILEASGHRVRRAADGLMGLTLFRQQTPDVAVLGERLSGLDGMGLARRIHEESAVPVLLLADRDDPADVVRGLEAGADDCLAKPFDGTLLLARVRALLRRTVPADQPSDTRAVRFGDLVYCPVSLVVRRDGEPVHLTTTELKLLREFAASPGTVLTRDLLLERVWDYAWSGDNRVVDVHVQRLRAKIGRDRIETVRGFGYKLRVA